MQKPVLALLLVLTLGAIAIVWARPDLVVPKIALVKNGEIAYDFNGDGRIDHVEVWQSGVLMTLRQDTSGDGRFDAFAQYLDGQPVVLEYDLDHDGVIDYRSQFVDGKERIEVLEDNAFVPVRKKE